MLCSLPVWYQLALIMALGAIWGSFVAAICSRWPRGGRITDGRSHCEHCHTILGLWDLIPIFSYIWLKGKCRYCAYPIGAWALYTELASALVGLMAMWVLDNVEVAAAAIFGWLLLPLVILDYQKLWLPDRLVFALGLVGLLAGSVLTPDISWYDRILGGMFGFLSLEGVRWVFWKLRNVEGMGGGDPKLFAAIGIWLGWQALPITLLLACIFGFMFIAATFAQAKKSALQLPFGSFLCVAGFSVALIG